MAALATLLASGCSSGDDPPSDPTWCEARAVLERKCQRCHASPPQNGAPFPLVTFEDTQEQDLQGNPRWREMLSAVERDFMPATFVPLQPPVEPLSPSEKKLLLAWFAAGAPADGGLDCQ